MGIRDDDPEHADDRAVGRRGARFPTSKQRQRFGTESDSSDPPAAPEVEGTPEPSGSKPRRGARYPPAKLVEEPEVEQRQEPEEAEAPPTPPPTPPAGRSQRPPPRTERVLAAPDDADDPSGHRLRVRPYVITKGRTKARQDLGVETLISTVENAPWDSARLSSEYLAVRRLCMQPRSVAEVAAVLSVPLGVARVLLSDLADGGFVHVHTTRFTAGGRPDHVLMRRVLEGLQKL